MATLGEVAPVAVDAGFSWTAAGAWGTFLALLGIIIRQVGPWRKQTTDASDKLIDQLARRLDLVEKQLATERRMNFIQTARLEARHAAQRALDRHKLTNRDQCLMGLLRILELSPERAKEAAKAFQEQLVRDRQDERLEAAEIHKAEMRAVEIAEQELDQQAEQTI